MPDIYKPHDKFFKKTFQNVKNVKDFLKIALPDDILKYIDFEYIKIEQTEYIDRQFKGTLSDIVVKTRIKNNIKQDKININNERNKKRETIEKTKYLNTDIYILFEHK